ncbi:MAG: 2-succinyl-5-enolpyruvyl-6-hydroxy-3-cyclohexene-1-carboxylic-acid synthase [Puniceicoccaceae bacterium]
MDSTPAERAAFANGPFGELVIQALHRMGVSHFVVSPGSRSTPLTLAIGDLPDETFTVMLDERSAAFHALGRIKATREPVALVCTSGTAGAHYYPAVIEAREAGLPLVVLTADRPPELRNCHAGQTIDQQKLFGTYPVFQAELPVPEKDFHLLRQVRELCRSAVQSALGPMPGPVHLNCPFREPFLPKAGSVNVEPVQELLSDLQPASSVRAVAEINPELPNRTLILAGPRPWKDREEDVRAMLRLSRKTGFPILADGSNPLRYRARRDDPVIVHYDRIVRKKSFWEDLKPNAIIQWGEPPTSKVLREKLVELDLPGYVIGSSKQGMNPLHARLQYGGSVIDFVRKVDAVNSDFSMIWSAEDQLMESALQTLLKENHTLFEGDIHRRLAEVLPDKAAVMYGSSLAIRDAEWFMPRSRKGLLPFSQRGANGIDGTVSIARGVASGLGERVWLVCGDLTFLHDANGLLNASKQQPGVFIVVVNNNGGGIFEFLPVAHQSDEFERMWATPQEVDIAQLVAAHGGRHVGCDGPNGLADAVKNWDGSGVVVAEVNVDRKESIALHRKLLKI